MISFLRKSGLMLIRGTLSLCALLFIALIAIQLVLVVGINIASSGKGSDFISGKINQVLTGSGYRIEFDALYYDPVRGLTIYDLGVSDAQGEFLSLDRFSLATSFMRSPMRTLELTGKGGTLQLDRLPESRESADIQGSSLPQPFEAPDIYFRKIILTHLSFDKVILGQAIAGKTYEFSPTLRAQATINDTLHLVLKLSPGLPSLVQGLEAPETIELDASLLSQTLDFALDKFSLSSPSYSLSMKGGGNLSENGTMGIAAQAIHKNLGPLTGDALTEAKAELRLDGPLSGPALNLSSTLFTNSLKERGLEDIKITLKTADISAGMKGDGLIETVFQGEPVTLAAKLSYEAPALSVSKLIGHAPDLSLSGDGNVSMDNLLFDGALRLAATDLSRYSELAGIMLAGKLEADVSFKPSAEGDQAAGIDASITNGRVDTIKAKTLSVQASLASLATPWPKSAKIDATSLQIAEGIMIDRLNAAIEENRAGSYKLSLQGAGRAPVPLSFDGGANLSNLTQKLPDFNDIAFSVKHGASSIRLAGDFTAEAVDLKLSTKNFRGVDIPASLPPQLDKLRIDMSAAITGTPSLPKTDLSATLRGIGAGSYQNASIDIKGQHDGANLSMNVTGRGTGIRTLDINAAMPMAWSIMPFHLALPPSSPLSGTIAADIDLAALAPLFLPPTQILSGSLTVNGTIAGTIAEPAPTATLALNDATFEDDNNGIVVADLNAAAAITRDSLILTSLSATDGDTGTIDGNGSILFANINATDIDLRLKNFNVPRNDLANAFIGANLSLKGSTHGLHLSGAADILEMNIVVPETFMSRIPQLNIVEDTKETGPGILDQLTLDIAINAENQIFVRGWGLDAEFGGDVTISGMASAPQFNGAFSARRGRYEEFGKRFRLAHANLRFQGDVPPSPYLDIEATTPAGDVTGSVLLTGPVSSPSLKFASTPSLPEDEVLSRILFGKDSARISPFQAVQLAQTIRRFSGQGGGGLDPLGMIRSATGLDDISVDTDESGASSVGVGKYLTDDVYLELSKGKEEDSGEATIQIEVLPSVNIESRIGQDAQGGGGIFWKRDY